MLRTEDLPESCFSDKSLLVGDLNARLRSLGSSLGSQNSNGLAVRDINDGLGNVLILWNSKLTHVTGGRLDWAIIFNMNEVQTCPDILYELVSGHFALKVTLVLDKVCGLTTRARYRLKNRQHGELICK